MFVTNVLPLRDPSLVIHALDDDYALSVLASALNKTSPSNTSSSLFRDRAHHAAFTLYNPSTNFMEARDADGSWAGPDEGWTEGDKWAYSFAVVFDIPGLVERRGGRGRFVQSLEEHFEGGRYEVPLCCLMK
jgi:putative alpha-1,2-mannosidase